MDHHYNLDSHSSSNTPLPRYVQKQVYFQQNQPPIIDRDPENATLKQDLPYFEPEVAKIESYQSKQEDLLDIDTEEACISRSVLVTGLPRSGTTIMGYIASLFPHQVMIHEPTNPSNRAFNILPGFTPLKQGSPFSTQFEDVSQWDPSEQAKARLYFDKIFHRACEEYSQVIIKDPTFVTSATWLVESYNLYGSVIMLRHPAGLINSWISMNERPLEELIELYNNDMKTKILPLIEKNSDTWYILRHEDFCRATADVAIDVQEYIFQRELSDVEKSYVQTSVLKYHSNSNKDHHKYHGIKMDSEAQIFSWKNELSPEAIEEIKVKTKDIWSLFYSEEDW